MIDEADGRYVTKRVSAMFDKAGDRYFTKRKSALHDSGIPLRSLWLFAVLPHHICDTKLATTQLHLLCVKNLCIDHPPPRLSVDPQLLLQWRRYGGFHSAQ